MAGFVLAAFLTIFTGVLVAIALGLQFYESRRKKQMLVMLRTVSGEKPAPRTKILRDPNAQTGWALEKLLARFDVSRKLEDLLRQAGLSWTAERLMLTIAGCGICGALAGAALPLGSSGPLRPLALGLICGSIPWWYVARKRKRRLAAFEEQLPEALDFLARSMRAGHAFTISLEMLSDDMADPLGMEFRTLFHEQNLGAPVETALRNLTQRVPLLDVRFFASAVLMQRQTGGNLGEILTRLAHVIRERFRLKGQVKAASAHGRLTASILTAMPVVTMLALLLVAPGYLEGMASDPDGKYLIGGSIMGQLVGFLVIRKIINIKV